MHAITTIVLFGAPAQVHSEKYFYSEQIYRIVNNRPFIAAFVAIPATTTTAAAAMTTAATTATANGMWNYCYMSAVWRPSALAHCSRSHRVVSCAHTGLGASVKWYEWWRLLSVDRSQLNKMESKNFVENAVKESKRLERVKMHRRVQQNPNHDATSKIQIASNLKGQLRARRCRTWTVQHINKWFNCNSQQDFDLLTIRTTNGIIIYQFNIDECAACARIGKATIENKNTIKLKILKIWK